MPSRESSTATMAESLSQSLHTVRIPPPPSPHHPLRSPKRRDKLPADEDPLLGKLSPEAILDALAAINAVSKYERQAKDLLTRSISQVSPEDRALGARAAIAAKKLREWLKEIQAWQWPKGVGIQQGKGFVSPPRDTSNTQTEFLGSLPASTVHDYEARLDEIHDGMASLDVEELKEHIMNVHIPGRSRPSSAHSALSSISAPPFSHVQLSDFTAVITATILRALPTLARLNMLLDTWSVRLLVLRQIPDLLHSLDTARASLDLALRSTEYSLQRIPSAIELASNKEKLAQVIHTAGSRMDTILDALEGREDSIPEIWIDNMDALEADFATWVQRAEKLAIEREWRSSEPVETVPSVAADREPQQDVPEDNNQKTPNPVKELDSETLETLSSPTVEETPSSTLNANAPIESIPSSENNRHLDPMFESPTPTQDTLPTSISEEGDVAQSFTTNDAPKVEQKISPTFQCTPTEPLPTLPDDSTLSDTMVMSREKSIPNSPNSISELKSSDDQSIDNTDTNTNQETKTSADETCHALDLSKESSLNNTEPQLDQQESELCHTEQPRSPISPYYAPESQTNVTLITPQNELDPPQDLSRAISKAGKISMLADLLPITTTASLPAQESPLPNSFTRGNFEDNSTKISEGLDTSTQARESQFISSSHPTSKPKDLEDGNSEQDYAHTAGDDVKSGISVLGYESNDSPRLPLQPKSPNSVKAISQNPEEHTASKSLGEPFTEVPATGHQSIDSLFEADTPLNPDVPVQSIESSVEHGVPSNPLQSHEVMTLGPSRKVSAGPPHGSAGHFSPGLLSSASDRTIREAGSPQLNSSMLHDLQTFQHTKNASLPLQRFIDDESVVNYPIHHDLHSDSSSSREELSDTLQHFREDSEAPRFRQRSESPPFNAIPRRAIRGPSSSLMRGTISSLNKVVGTPDRNPSGSSSYETSSVRLHSRHRLGSPYDADSDSSPWRRKSSGKNLLQAPMSNLHNQPSMESISSYVSSNGTGRRRYSFSTDGGSFAIRPVNEADSDLQEKIHTILTGIPGKIRLSNKPSSDFDQQSVISSISSTKRSRIKPRSPFSTPSRAGTPTPSESSSRQRRTASHKSEDKTVRVYHLHHRGKTEPTKLFVRTVGEDGERVMVRVGGGWADLGEYLREYVLHHGRQTPSSGNVVEVKGLPATSPSPGSTTSAATAVARPNSPVHESAISQRPASSLSVRKTRRTSKPSELPELAIDTVETGPDNLPLPSLPLGRRTSISSINSVSVSSIIGDGSNVYSPHPGSARTPHSYSVSTPLGLAGPKPRNRHVSMTPESEAWVEDVIGQARRTSSNVKPTQRHNDHRAVDREALNSSRMSIRSVGDIASVGRNKRVTLKGLGTQDRS